MYELRNLPPDVHHALPSVQTLWPPDHKMVDISILGVTDPECDSVAITITNITQDEPTNGLSDGDTCPDAISAFTSTAQVRAERNGAGNGRVYTVYFTATDGRGVSSNGSVTVQVPRNTEAVAVDDRLLFDSTRCPF